LVEEDPLLALDELFELLQKPEITEVFQLAPALRQLRKADQLAALPQFDKPQHYPAGAARPATLATAT
jgi:hypothetical protein